MACSLLVLLMMMMMMMMTDSERVCVAGVGVDVERCILWLRGCCCCCLLLIPTNTTSRTTIASYEDRHHHHAHLRCRCCRTCHATTTTKKKKMKQKSIPYVLFDLQVGEAENHSHLHGGVVHKPSMNKRMKKQKSEKNKNKNKNKKKNNNNNDIDELAVISMRRQSLWKKHYNQKNASSCRTLRQTQRRLPSS